MCLQPSNRPQFFVGVFASLGSLLFGYDLGVIAQVIISKSFLDEFQPNENETCVAVISQSGLYLTDSACSGAVVSVFTGGAFFGATFAGPTGDYLGRKLTILVGSVVFVLGGSLQTAAQSLDYLYAGRCIAGLGYVLPQI